MPKVSSATNGLDRKSIGTTLRARDANRPKNRQAQAVRRSSTPHGPAPDFFRPDVFFRGAFCSRPLEGSDPTATYSSSRAAPVRGAAAEVDGRSSSP